jgi:hypothetical protein
VDMSQIDLLKVILKQPNVFPDEYSRDYARQQFLKKLERRDKKIIKQSQLKIFST